MQTRPAKQCKNPTHRARRVRTPTRFCPAPSYATHLEPPVPMTRTSLVSYLFLALCAAQATGAAASPGPNTVAPLTTIAAPVDKAYPGELRIAVDASDVDRRIIRIHETLSGVEPGTVLLYPKWIPGGHAPEGAIDKVAGLRITAAGKPVPWTRDPVEVFAFRPQLPAGTGTIDIDFTYLSPTSPKVGDVEMSRDLMRLEWISLVLYPSGYYARQIPVTASLTLPAGWQMASALEIDSTSGALTRFKATNLEVFVDSPLYGGRYVNKVDLDPGSAVPVHLDLFADRPELLAIKPEQVAAHRALVQQAMRLYGARHYRHYDFLYALSDQIKPFYGLEHMESSEDGSDPESITGWDRTAFVRDLLAHEYTHSWNGKYRRPADLWTPNYNVPMQDSLLWVYEGQTQYWGRVLAARSGLWTVQQALDALALTAAYYDTQAGRQWRPLQDTVHDEIINPRRPMSWPDWQRFEDYYSEGQLIWLDVDTLIRERSGGKRSLDDFARAFFGVNDGSSTILTYTFEDVVRTLNGVEPYDWAGFLRERVETSGRPAPLDGLRRGGYRLVYTDVPNEFGKAENEQLKTVSLNHSIGIELDDKDDAGTVAAVGWGSAAFKAGLTEGARILAVNGIAYTGDILKDAIRAAKGTTAPLELIVKNGDRYRVVSLDYHDGLRYPHLERDAAAPARLEAILAPRP